MAQYSLEHRLYKDCKDAKHESLNNWIRVNRINRGDECVYAVDWTMHRNFKVNRGDIGYEASEKKYGEDRTFQWTSPTFTTESEWDTYMDWELALTDSTTKSDEDGRSRVWVALHAVGGAAWPAHTTLRCEVRRGAWERTKKTEAVFFKDGDRLIVDFGRKPDSTPLSFVLHCEITHARPASADDEKTVGPGVEPRSARSPGSAQPQPVLASLLRSRDMADVTLEARDEGVKAHKLILSAGSKVFHNIFANEQSETSSDVLRMKDFDSKIVEALLSFLYTNQVHNLEETAKELLQVASQYEVEELKEICMAELHPSINIENAAQVLIMAHENDVQKMKESAGAFIKMNFTAVSATEDWKKMRKYPQLLTDMLV